MTPEDSRVIFGIWTDPKTKIKMTDNPTIWVVNDAGHSTEKALKIVPNGIIKPLTVGNINPLLVDRLARHLVHGIVSYGKREDYVLLCGYITVNALAVHLWMMHFGHIKILQWNAKRRHYELTEKDQEDFENMIQKELEKR